MRQTKATYNARYRAKIEGKTAQARARRNWQCKRKYGITLAEREAIYAEQQGLCGLCGKPLPTEAMCNDCDLDHNHVTGQHRALVHRKCNVILGIMEKNPELVPLTLEYLRKWN